MYFFKPKNYLAGVSLFDVSAIAIAVASALALSGSRGDLVLAFLPLVLFAFAWIFPKAIALPDIKLIGGMIFVFLVLDAPAGYPFWEYDPITEKIGALFYESFQKTFGITGLRATGIELLSYLIAIWVMLVNGRSEIRNFFQSPYFRWVMFVGTIIPVVGILALIWGIGLKGNSLGNGIIQVRFLPLMSCWLYTGYVALKKPHDVLPIMTAIVAAMTFKSLQGWWAYFVEFGMVMGRREYLIEHLTSDQLATAMFIIMSGWWLMKEKVPTLWMAGLMVIMMLPYVVNERRASFIGVALSLVLSPLILYQYIKKKHVIAAVLTGVFGIVYVAATWNISGPLGIPARTVKSFVEKDESGQPDYRDLENFNLYSAIMDNKFLGLGFGRGFPLVVEMPDIRKAHPLFDVLPHNNVLYLWAFAGPAGMAALGCFVAFCIAMLVRLNMISSDPVILVFSFVGFTMVIRWLVYVYADLGLFENRTIAVLGLFMGMGFKILRQSVNRKEVTHAL